MLTVDAISPEQPTAELFESLAVFTMLRPTAVGPAAFAVIGHPVADDDHQPQLLGLAQALKLRPSRERMSDSGRRLVLLSVEDVFLIADNVSHLLRLPPVSKTWHGFVAKGGPVCVVVGRDPLPAGADLSELGRYLGRISVRGRAHVGIAGLCESPIPALDDHAIPDRWLYQGLRAKVSGQLP